MRRILSMILAIAMIFTMVSTTALVSAKESSFTDVIGTKDEWANEYIEKMVEKKILDGVGGGKFEPEGLLTREQFAKVLVAAIPQEDKGITAEFDDVAEGQWYVDYIEKAVASGIMKGKGDGKFGVGENIKRCDMALGIARLDKTDEELKAYEDKIPDSVGDKETIPEYAKGAMGYCYEKGIFSGDENGNFNPFDNTTRAQIAKVICVYVEGLEEEPTDEPTKEPTKEPTGEVTEEKVDFPISTLTITGEEVKISLFNDTHFKYGSWFSTDQLVLQKMIQDTVDNDKPDLLVFNGDFITVLDKNGNGTAKEYDRIIEIIDFLSELDVKWTFTFGVSDNEYNIDRKLIVQYAMKSPNCLLNPINNKGMRGLTNSMIEVKDQNGEIKDVLMLFDTAREGITGEQIDFLKSQAARYQKTEPNAKLYLFAHRSLPQANDMKYKGTFYGYGESKREKAPDYGVFDFVKTASNINGMFFGYDHQNAYYGEYEGVFMLFGKAAGSFSFDGTDNSNETGFTKVNLKNNGEKSIQYVKYDYASKVYTDVEVEKKEYRSECPVDLKYDQDGNFKLMQLTDNHVTYNMGDVYVTPDLTLPAQDAALYVIMDAVSSERPDFVIFTGDQVFKYYNANHDNILLFEKIGSLMDQIGVPWTFISGNHDGNLSENLYTWDQLYESLKKYKTFAGFDNELGEDGLPIANTGVGNAAYELKNSEGKPEWAFFTIDNSWTDKYSQSVVDWFNVAQNRLRAENPEVQGIAFAHRPFITYGAQANYESKMINGKIADGYNIEFNDYGLSETMAKGMMKAFFVGHYHKNDCIAKFEEYGKNVYKGFGKTGDFIAYNTGVPTEDGSKMQRGSRLFEFKEGDTSKFTTYVREVGGNYLYNTVCE